MEENMGNDNFVFWLLRNFLDNEFELGGMVLL